MVRIIEMSHWLNGADAGDQIRERCVAELTVAARDRRLVQHVLWHSMAAIAGSSIMYHSEAPPGRSVSSGSFSLYKGRHTIAGPHGRRDCGAGLTGFCVTTIITSLCTRMCTSQAEVHTSGRDREEAAKASDCTIRPQTI